MFTKRNRYSLNKKNLKSPLIPKGECTNMFSARVNCILHLIFFVEIRFAWTQLPNSLYSVVLFSCSLSSLTKNEITIKLTGISVSKQPIRRLHRTFLLVALINSLITFLLLVDYTETSCCWLLLVTGILQMQL